LIGYSGLKGVKGLPYAASSIVRPMPGFEGPKGDKGLQGDKGFPGQEGRIGFRGLKGYQGNYIELNES
jgi:Collagen triple helix repeat (20 copies)